ncbi:hypothetical protein BT69DRAFT_1298502 [Atractiella rhizophila]|nr:hypothetical protein BT69DRAFT_1298502 [Atractiella rhizophila]
MANDAEDEIFGGDSDLSDVGEEDILPQAERTPTPGLEDASGGEEYGDDYVAEDVFGEKKWRKPKKSACAFYLFLSWISRKKKDVLDEQEEPVILDPVAQKRRDLEERLNAIVKPAKPRKRKRKEGEDDLMADEEVYRLKQQMLAAASTDQESNEDGKPAVAKLAMLSTVVETLQKVALQDSIMEGGVLEAVKRWLEPLPDKSLPALNIQKSLFDFLMRVPMDTQSLKGSELGKVILFYTKCKRVEPGIKRMADTLLTTWMRPIIRRSATYRTLPIAEATEPTLERSQSVARRRLPTAMISRGSGDPKGKEGLRRHAAIPQAISKTFRIAPPRMVADGAEVEGKIRKAGEKKIRIVKRKLMAQQNESRRM